MIAYLAQLYVDVIEPGLRILAVVALVLGVIYLINMLRGGDRKGDLVTNIVNGFFRLVYKILALLGVALVKSFRILMRNLHLLFAVIRDFFTSKDL